LSNLPTDGGEDAVRQAIADLLGLDVSLVVLTPGASRRSLWIRSQHHVRSLGTIIKFQVYSDSSQAVSVAETLQADSLAARLAKNLQEKHGISVQVSVAEKPDVVVSPDLVRPPGELWEQIEGQYLLRKCAPGYLIVNSTIDTQLCKECEANTFSFDPSTGCDPGGLCENRNCIPCPIGVKCEKGSAQPIKHFVPKSIKVGNRVHPLIVLKMEGFPTRKFFCDQITQECTALDASLPKHAQADMSGDHSYMWEYVVNCNANNQPCDKSHAPAVLLRSCPNGTQWINSSLSGIFSPSLQECSPCAAGQYITNPTTGTCNKCPSGADCPSGAEFHPTTPESVWKEETVDGKIYYRVVSCPPGFALVRNSEPSADSCKACPPNTYNLDGSRYGGVETSIDDFCVPCPSSGADCNSGGKSITILEGFYSIRESEVDDVFERRTGTVTRLSTYQCPVDACAENNECKNNRTGLVCGHCPVGWAMEGNGCRQCATDTDTVMFWRIIFGVVGSVVFLVIWYMFSWRHVFSNQIERVIMSCLRRCYAKFRKAEEAHGKAESAHASLQEKREQIEQVLLDPRKVKMMQQYFKIIIAAFQVLGGFVAFKVTWPDAMQSTIISLYKIGKLFKFDILELPGLSCPWVDFDYQSKLFVALSGPLIVAVLLVLPVAISWLILVWHRQNSPRYCLDHRRERSPDGDDSPKQRFSKTVDAFVNNIMFWFFLVYPGSSLWALQTFNCRKIGNESILVADYKTQCPFSEIFDVGTWNLSAQVSAMFCFIYPVGVPLMMYCVLWLHGVPQMACEKVSRGLVSRLISTYLDAKTSSSSQSLAKNLGLPLGMESQGDGHCSDLEFHRRTKDFYDKIFCEHTHCRQECNGHSLPMLPHTILKELGWPAHLPAFYAASIEWFKRIDADQNGCIEPEEMSNEFVRMGLTQAQSKYIFKYYDLNNNKTLIPSEFHGALMQIFDMAIPGVEAAQLITLAHLMHVNDADENDKLDFFEFQKLAHALVLQNFEFSGTETKETISAVQLGKLRDHEWKRRERTDEVEDHVAHATEKVESTLQHTEEEEKEEDEGEECETKLYRSTRKQKQILNKILDFVKGTARKHFKNTMLFVKAVKLEVDSSELPILLCELKAEIHRHLRLRLLEMVGYKPNRCYSSYNEVVLLEKGADVMHSLLVQAKHHEEQLRNVLWQQVQDVAYRLRNEGLIVLAPLQWDGSLGQHEVMVVSRLGFLLNAYQVQTWYWEIIEMVIHMH
jgi:hypothetical protein